MWALVEFAAGLLDKLRIVFLGWLWMALFVSGWLDLLSDGNHVFSGRGLSRLVARISRGG